MSNAKLSATPSWNVTLTPPLAFNCGATGAKSPGTLQLSGGSACVRGQAAA